MRMELKDEDIKKALECCIRDDYDYCKVCPYLNKNKPCQENLIRDCFGFINRQQAEIERLQSLCTAKDVIIKEQEAESERLKNSIIALMSYLDILGADKTDTSFINQATEFNKQIRADIKSEAIKEFAAKLKCGVSITSGVITCADIDNLLTEMVGEQNA